MAVRLLCSALLRCSSAHAQRHAAPAIASALISTSLPKHIPSAPAALGAKFPFTTSTVLGESFKAAIKKEIKYEQENYEKVSIVEKGPPPPFTLEETAGDTAVSLKREYNGQQISVDASVNLQDNLAVGNLGDEEGVEDEEDEYSTNSVNFNVTVTQGEQSLVFECVSDGTFVDIRHVSLEPSEGLSSETAYTGPVFQELDEGLQEQFREYLEKRGVNEAVGEYLRHLLYDKEQREYVQWLTTLEKFVSS